MSTHPTPTHFFIIIFLSREHCIGRKMLHKQGLTQLWTPKVSLWQKQQINNRNKDNKIKTHKRLKGTIVLIR